MRNDQRHLRRPDGNLVDLKASIGTVKQTGSGKLRPGSTRRSATTRAKLVYITATDSKGLKGEIPFRLKVKGRR